MPPIHQKLDKIKRAADAGMRGQCIQDIIKLVQDSPPIGPAWVFIAQLAANYDEVTLTRRIAEQARQGQQGNLQLALALAGMLAGLGQVVEARDMMAPFTKSHPADPALNHFLGTVMSQLGKSETAQLCYRRTLASWANSGQTWYSLAAEKKFQSGDIDIGVLRSRIAESTSTAPDNRSSLQFALGKALLDTGDVKEAMTAFQKGAIVARAQRPFNLAADTALVTDIMSDLGRLLEERRDLPAAEKCRTIFVLGLPRTGSTLVEQILCSHSQVTGGAEVNFLRHVINEVGGGDTQALQNWRVKQDPARANDEDPWAPLARLYNHLMDDRFGRNGLTVDKSLGNSRYLGLLQLLFPNAKFIWMRRDFHDTAWSCYRTHFNKGLNWTWDFSDIAHYFNNENRLFRFWTEPMPSNILPVQYEDLVENPDACIRNIFNHAELPFEEEVLNFHQTDRAVATASVGQIRSPIHGKAIGGSQEVRSWMKPFDNVFETKATGSK